MVAYPESLDRRFTAEMKAMRAAIRKLQARTAGIDSGAPLALLPARIDPAYSSGDPKALINGSTTLTGPYNHLATYTPVANDLVLVTPMPVSATAAGTVTQYIVLGKIT